MPCAAPSPKRHGAVKLLLRRLRRIPLLEGFLFLAGSFSVLFVWQGSYLLPPSEIAFDFIAERPLPWRKLDPSRPPIKVAHAISLIKCDNNHRVKGFLDALIVLRHSIHLNSVHAHPNSTYSYQMYAIVHEDSTCVEHVPLLQRLGYTPLVRPTPVNISEIPNEWYRNHVEQENCCGSAEFIKLYAYTLTEHPVVVHWDLDVLVLQPLDDLYDAMLLEGDAGRAARARLAIQRPHSQVLPDDIQAYYTRDITSSRPWEPVSPVQGGFLAVRPSVEQFESMLQVIRSGDYSPGEGRVRRGPGTGWGGKGYGGFQGAMAYQGIIAYYYDQVYPGHSVELDVCRWNQVVADVIWRGPEMPEHEGQCREYPADGNHSHNTPESGECEDCRIIPVSETMTAHYTATKKPWDCTLPYPRVPHGRMKAHTYRLQELTNITTSGLLFREYFKARKDVEQRIAEASSQSRGVFEGKFHPEYFLGYCEKGKYLPMEIPEDFEMNRVYKL